MPKHMSPESGNRFRDKDMHAETYVPRRGNRFWDKDMDQDGKSATAGRY